MRTLVVLLGILLIVGGTMVLTYQGVTLTTQERQVGLGPFRAATEPAQRTFPLSPVLGGLVLAAGAVIVFLVSMTPRKPKPPEDTASRRRLARLDLKEREEEGEEART